MEKTMKKLSLIIVALFAATLIAADAKNLLGPTNDPKTWRFEQHETGKGTMKADGNAIVFDVTEVSGTDWHVQANVPNLDLKEGKEYVLKFQAKASAERSVQVNAMIDQDDWHAIGLQESIDLTKDWKPYEYTFKAENVVANKNRVGFTLGNEKGQVMVKEMTLTQK
jgi:hypothetical protein